MGAQESDLRAEEIDELKECSCFSQKEIQRLYKRFKRLDKDGSGTISTDEFLSIPELAMNPLVMRVVSVFDVNQDEQVNFKQFVTILSVFHLKASREAKIEFAFKIYDVDNDGFISEDDLFQVLKLMVGKNLGVEQVKQIAAKTIQEGDLDEDGKLSREEFDKMFENKNVESKMSLQFTGPLSL